MAGIAHVITPDSASGAQIIDGSLKFQKAHKKHLSRTPGSAGNQKTWTLSLWFKKQNFGDPSSNTILKPEQRECACVTCISSRWINLSTFSRSNNR